ncbi:MAG: YciI family protein [Candidatus Dormiibacterota bacterium]
MKYLLIVRSEEPAPEAEPVSPAGCEGWSEDLEQRGKLLAGGILRPSRHGVTVQVREGRALRTDGPFTETKEMIAGFNLLECESMEEAAEIASRHPVARTGAIEIRAIWET